MSLIDNAEITQMRIDRGPSLSGDFKTVRYDLRNTIDRSTNTPFAQTDLGKFLSTVHYCFAEQGPWLAGGALRRTLLGERITSDYDIYFANEQQKNAFETRILKLGAKFSKETEKHREYVLDGMVIQLIYFEYYDSMEHVISNFDFTLTMFITDGETLVAGEYSLWDLGRRRLVVHKLRFPRAALRRLIKYSTQGFYACTGCLAEMHRILRGLPEETGEPQYID